MLLVPFVAFGRIVPRLGERSDAVQVFGVVSPFDHVHRDVFASWDAFEIFNVIIEGVSILVVDVESVGDWSVMIDPNGLMVESAPRLDDGGSSGAEISSAGQILGVRVSVIFDSVDNSGINFHTDSPSLNSISGLNMPDVVFIGWSGVAESVVPSDSCNEKTIADGSVIPDSMTG